MKIIKAFLFAKEVFMSKKILIVIISLLVAAGAVTGAVLLFRHEHTEVIDAALSPTCLKT